MAFTNPVALVAAALLFALPASAGDLSRSIETTGDVRLDGILSDVTWAKSELTYVFPDTPFARMPAGIGFKPLADGQRATIKVVLDHLSTITLMHFSKAGGQDANLTFAEWNQQSRLGRVDSKYENGAGEWFHIPGQTWISESDSRRKDSVSGSRDFMWWLHEIGHIVGLEHTHNNFTRRPGPIELDNISHTVMSYRIQRELRLIFPNINAYPSTYMPLDMLALQHLYGPNWQTNAEDSIYKFSPETGDHWVNGERQTGNPDGKLFLALWDGGGSDTLDFSAYDTNGTFDMRPGGFSTPAEVQRVDFGKGEKAEGSIAMPYLPKGDRRALIENIIVGGGDNTIRLNQANNRVSLGSGSNTLMFFPGNGKDQIDGYNADDVIDLCGYHIPKKMIQIESDGADQIIKIDQWPRDEIRLRSVSSEDVYIRSECAFPADASRATESQPTLAEKYRDASDTELEQIMHASWAHKEFGSAVEFARLAYARRSTPSVAYRLGTAYFGGYGVDRNLDMAWRYMSVPALDDARYALYYRGLILSDPEFDGRDVAAASVFLEKARELGVAEAGSALSALAQQGPASP